MKQITMIIFSLLLYLAACNAPGTEPTIEATIANETSTSAPTATAASATPTEAAVRPTPTEESIMTSEAVTTSEPVIILKRSGGFAGLEDEWIIYADGTVTGSPTTNSPLSTEHIAQILADAEAGGFFELDDEYIDEGHCCDFFNYEVTLTVADGRSQTITTVEQTPSQPPILAEIIQELNFLLFHEKTQE